MVWNNVVKIKDKAVVDFIAGVHTPIILCRKTKVRGVKKRSLSTVITNEIIKKYLFYFE
jgi:hypothetical protein